MITKQKDTDFKILLDLPDAEFFKFCAKFKLDKDEYGKEIIPLEYKNKIVNQLCNNENLWRERLFKYYWEFYPEEGQTWKKCI